jgi:NADPH:quinone reductase-like Zn-dependent oxidoreductase
MKSYWIQTRGEKIDIELRETPVPAPGPGQLLVRLRAAALNRGEFIPRYGLHKRGAKPAGLDGAGEVEKAGAGISGFRAGDRIMGRCAGSFAEYALMAEYDAITIPSSLSWEEGASIPIVSIVTHEMLVAQGALKGGEWLLVTGASSGVGVAALQAAKTLGAKVIGTSGSAEKLEKLESLGLDAGIRTRSADFCDAVMRATGGQGANLIVNTVGGSLFAECVRALAFEGRLATVGYVDGVMKSEIDIEALHGKRLKLFGVSNKLRTPEQRAASVRGFVADLLPAIADGRIRPVIDRVFAFSELRAAKSRMESDAHLGKIVVRMDD